MASMESCPRLCIGRHNDGRNFARSDNGSYASPGFGHFARAVLFCLYNHQVAL